MRLFSTLFMILSAGFLFSQVCTIDYGNNAPGTYPGTLPNGFVGQSYGQDLTLVFPADTNGVDFTSFRLTSIELPLGLSWYCLDESNGCEVDPQQDPFTCVRVYGTPAQNGTYTVNVISHAELSDGNVMEYSFQVGLDINEPTGMSSGLNPLFSYTPSQGCETATVNFTILNPLNIPAIPGQTAGITHSWDFGNGNTSSSATPPTQQYLAPGNYTVIYNQTIDTVGFYLKKVVLNSVACSDAVGFGNPDIYIEILDGSNNKVYSTESTPTDADLPITFNMNLLMNNPPYKINVLDDDSDNWWGTADDNCVDNAENDYPVPIYLPSVSSVGAVTQTGNAGGLSFTYNINKYVEDKGATATIKVYANPAAPIIDDSNAPTSISTDDLGYVYHWNTDGVRVFKYRGTEINPHETGNYTVTAVDNHGCYSTSDYVFLDYTGLAEENINTFTMYPNPTDAMVNIQFSEVVNQGVIYVVDLSGRIVMQENIQAASNISLDVTTLRSGMYNVILTDSNGKASFEKLIIQ
ncbi:MAG: T9SS type A sorting domain-containing protein [Brumimicrobium sp.]|nr:T9SS type A sorting domain-containing protein [Brumimicrobium sp.]